MVGSACARQYAPGPPPAPGLHQGAHALLQKEGVPLGALDQALFERLQTSIVPKQTPEEDLDVRRRQRVEPKLGVVGLRAPAVLILGAVVDQQEHADGGQALHQAIEERLGLRVDPVEVLEGQQERLHLALPQDQAFERVQGALAALRRIESLPVSLLHRHLQEGEEGWTLGPRAGSSMSSRPVSFLRMRRLSSRSSS